MASQPAWVGSCSLGGWVTLEGHGDGEQSVSGRASGDLKGGGAGGSPVSTRRGAGLALKPCALEGPRLVLQFQTRGMAEFGRSWTELVSGTNGLSDQPAFPSYFPLEGLLSLPPITWMRLCVPDEAIQRAQVLMALSLCKNVTVYGFGDAGRQHYQYYS